MAKSEYLATLDTIKQPESGDANPVLNFWKEVLNVQIIDESPHLLDAEEILRQQKFRIEFARLEAEYSATSQSASQELSQLREIQDIFQKNELTPQQSHRAHEITRTWNNSTELIQLDEAIGNCSRAVSPMETSTDTEHALQEHIQQLSLLDATPEERVAFYSNQLAQAKKENPLGALFRKISDQIPQVRRKRAAEQQGRITVLRTQSTEIHQKLAQNVLGLAQKTLENFQKKVEDNWVGLDIQALSQQVLIDSAAMDQLVMSTKRKVASVVPSELMTGDLAAPSSECVTQWKRRMNTEIEHAIAAKEMELATAKNQTVDALRALVADTPFLSSESFTMIQQARSVLPTEFAHELVTTAAQKTRHRCNLSEPEHLLRTINARVDSLRQTKEKPKEEAEANLALANEIDASKNIVVAELFSTQTYAWLQGYQKVWEHFFSANTATEPIAFDTTEARLLFTQQGSEIGFGSFNVIDCLKRTADSHNRILEFITEWRTQKAPEADEGTEFFSALVSVPDHNIYIKPYGTVKIDLTPPITSVRLVFSDTRDYKLAVGELSIKDYLPADARVPQSSSGGMSFLTERSFTFEGIGSIKLPFTAHLEKPQVDWMEQLRIHEDSHQAIGYRPYNETEAVVSGERRADRTHIDNLLRRTLNVEEEKGGPSMLRAELRNSIHDALLRARDEVQAYLSDGTELPEIFEILSNSDLYDYVAPADYRVAEIQAIEARQDLLPEEKKVAIAQFKSEVVFARKMYLKTLKRFIRNVQRLKLVLEEKFTDPTDARQALILIERNMLPEEQAIMARFLSISSDESAAIHTKRHALFKNEDAALSQQATEDIGARETQLKKLDDFLKIDQGAAETIISIARTFAEHVPSYYAERFPQVSELVNTLTQNSATGITAEVLQTAQDFFAIVTPIGQELTWTTDELQQRNEYFSWRKEYGKSGAQDEYKAATDKLNTFLHAPE